jgi:hypothetical protein
MERPALIGAKALGAALIFGVLLLLSRERGKDLLTTF